ncbi:hypothetical protein CGLO_07791 [Colletotrichum gloeosporioides Cg-14]|uniref:Uncharacterized protein n=1 Tax=Colletotrichum gloeosporioides (strain Cg-14) TaxID=1237896 RepID=T0KIA8_COLGC|nr:hypothetical protein CGLO_07791 [Colletotrichum gloeosporioides Cg-14]
MNIKETTQGVTGRLEGKRSEAKHLNKVRQDLQKRTPDLEAIALTFLTDRMEWDTEMNRQEQAITDSSALHNEPERVFDIEPAPSALDPKRNQPAGQEVGDDLVALLPTSLKDKNEATTQTTTAQENMKRDKKMLVSRETVLEKHKEMEKDLRERISTLEKSLGEQDATIKALEEANGKAITQRNNYTRRLMTLRASEIMHKNHVAKVEGDCDRYKEEATQLRSDLETAKQNYDKDMRGLQDKYEQAVLSANKAHEDSKTLHKKELGQMQQRIDEATTARNSEKLAMEKRIEEATTAHQENIREMQGRIDEATTARESEKLAMEKRIEEYEDKVEKLQQKSKETADAHTSKTKDLQKRLDDAAATHKTEMKEMQQRIDEATNTHRTEKQATEKRIDESNREIKWLTARY